MKPCGVLVLSDVDLSCDAAHMFPLLHCVGCEMGRGCVSRKQLLPCKSDVSFPVHYSVKKIIHSCDHLTSVLYYIEIIGDFFFF